MQFQPVQTKKILSNVFKPPSVKDINYRPCTDQTHSQNSKLTKTNERKKRNETRSGSHKELKVDEFDSTFCRVHRAFPVRASRLESNDTTYRECNEIIYPERNNIHGTK